MSACAHGESLCDRLLNRVDERLEFQKILLASPTLDQLDFFSSSATMRPLLFSKSVRQETLSWLRSGGAQSESRLAAVFDKSALSQKTNRYLRFFESRFWVAAQIICSLSSTTPDPREVRVTFFRKLSQYVTELRSANLITKNDLGTILSQLAHSTETYNFEQAPANLSGEEFQISSLAAFHEPRSFDETLNSVATDLQRRLMELPVGLSFGLTDFTASVRFGDMQFFSSWWTPKLKTREAFLRKAEGDGAIDFVLKMTTSQKKQVALLLDRTDDALDPIFGPEKKQIGNDWQTCGSFARSVFNRCGVTIVTPIRYVPSPTVFSLLIQHKLGVGPVETVEISGVHRRLLVNGLSDIAMHDGIPGLAEFAAYCIAGHFALTHVITACF